VVVFEGRVSAGYVCEGEEALREEYQRGTCVRGRRLLGKSINGMRVREDALGKKAKKAQAETEKRWMSTVLKIHRKD
ncbi:hypothetical protein, partial [Bartonella henselae]|uniref:hypothetical protein n=1 Tax=Bartonella henselae TaxID=38323 RepID=UPI0025AA9B59